MAAEIPAKGANMLRPYTSSTICAAQAGELLINVVGNKPIDPNDWSNYIAVFAPEARTWLADPSRVPVVLTYSPTVGPNAAQRAQLAKEHGAAMAMVKRVAFCTESVLVRGAMTALGWVSRAPTTVRPFWLTERDKALEWLAESAVFDRTEAIAEIQRMLRQLSAGEIARTG